VASVETRLGRQCENWAWGSMWKLGLGDSVKIGLGGQCSGLWANTELGFGGQTKLSLEAKQN